MEYNIAGFIHINIIFLFGNKIYFSFGERLNSRLLYICSLIVRRDVKVIFMGPI